MLNEIRKVPFPLNLSQGVYESALLAASDDDSDLARQFRYFARFSSDPHLDWNGRLGSEGHINLLIVAAAIGDLSFLDMLLERFGGVVYVYLVVCEALQHHQIEFYLYYVSISRLTCILNEPFSYHIGLYTFWAQSRFNILHHVLVHQPRIDLIRFLYENVILGYPSANDLPDYGNGGGRSSIGNATALVSCHDGYPGLTRAERHALFALLIDKHAQMAPIVDYFVLEQGLQFTREHLDMAATRSDARLHEFVLAHLEPDPDPEPEQPRCFMKLRQLFRCSCLQQLSKNPL